MKIANKVLKFLICVFLLLLLSCGGGSRGTGGTDFIGKILNTDSSPRADVEVTLLETGDSDTSDTEGNFNIKTKQATSSTTLALEDDTLSTEVSLGDVSQAARVELSVEVDEAENTAEVTDVSTTPREESSGNSEGESNEEEMEEQPAEEEEDQNDEAEEDNNSGHNSGSHNDNHNHNDNSNHQQESNFAKKCREHKDRLGDKKFKKKFPNLYKRCQKTFGQG